METKNIWRFFNDSDLSGYTLIIPSVAVGNVGQLTCDLLVSSLKMNKIASVYSSALIPVLGYDPYNLSSNNLSSCCELYKSTSRNIAVLQIRAPLVYKFAREFLEDVVRTFKQKLVKEIIILASSFAHEKKHILTSPFRYIANDQLSQKSSIVALGWIEHEKTDNALKIFGGGYAALLYSIVEETGLPCMLLYKYCSEGDNTPDAYDMINQLGTVLPIFEEKPDIYSQLIQPVSWKLLFGRPPPADIY